MNTQEKRQLEVVKENITPNSRPHFRDINADAITRINCGKVMLLECKSKYSGENWRFIEWLNGEVVKSKAWIIKESPTPIDKLAEELRDAL